MSSVVRQGHLPQLQGKYPAKKHAQRVAQNILAQAVGQSGLIYLESQKTRLIEDNDTPQPFRQRRPFFYLSGCDLPDCCLIYDISADKLTLLIPPLEADEVIWSGLPLSPSDALGRYDVDNVILTTDLNPTLASYAKTDPHMTLFAIPDQVSKAVSLSSSAHTDLHTLRTAIEQERVVKDSYEIALIAKANQISALAHKAALEKTSSASNEQEVQGAFIGTCISNGCRTQAYPPIIAGGTNASTLHYVKNDDPLQDKLNLLLDAGGEYRCYSSDVTRTFPIFSPSFTKESQGIYDIVDEMQSTSFSMLRAGVLWEDVHVAAHKVAINGLTAIGILKGDQDELLEKRISVAFFPHGLGHYIGLDTHDVGGNPDYADKDLMFRYLRVRGRLPKDCVITVEPGIYFCKFIIDPYLDNPDLSKYIDRDVLKAYWDVGGVRIEDNVWVKEDGYENLTTAAKL